MPGDVEGIALAVAEAVDDGAAQTAFLTNGLPQGLRFTPVALQVLSLSDHKGLLTGGQHLFDLVRLRQPPLRVVGAVFIR